ncbi:hypothetical protein HHK36_009611 [Tetracentron sinense]|uniref:Glycosyltransferase N-terminal domain-containing protein n=1 Tax=Tetracentron sinense TaxID=13715 RepID=A0A834ZLM8_TETSI|nr:hypothetical protein HHK36_009611 [Tetracentron sinense]
MDSSGALHVVMFPWLAMGHLIPFLELSKRLAQKGHRVSFVSTPRNIKRLPQISPDLSPLINFVSLPLPHIDTLPENAEASIDIPAQKSQSLKMAYDGLEAPLTTFLQNSVPNWIIFDFAAYWLPEVAAKLGVPCVYLSLSNAASLGFMGPPSSLLGNEETVLTIEDITVSPKWVPFPSCVVFRPHELVKIMEGIGENESGVSDAQRIGLAIQGSDVVALRTSVDFEPEWINLLHDLYKKTVIPIGLLPPLVQDVENEGDAKWVEIKEWLDKHERESIVYVALGSEAILSREELNELALGLEKSKLPFFWVLRKPPGSTVDESAMLPKGFEDRTRGRGIVYMSWAPQVRILAHPSVGGFLTHCGWNSVIEGLGFGRALVLLPVMNEQGLNARLLEGKKVGLEIPRNERDGSFTSDSVAESVRVVMVEKEGEPFRTKAKEMKEVFGDRNLNDRYVDGFFRYLEEHRSPDGTSS